MKSQPRLWLVLPLLFGSGFCALLYQTTWLREFRLIFGASTAACAAVLGIFMGGIGLGSAILGPRSEAKSRPLEYYARLELLIAASALVSPFLLWLVRHAYLGMGGTLRLGLPLGTTVRLLLSALAIGAPAFFMGGTLPAAVRAAMPEDDKSRRSVAWLYGVNTLGAVTGAFAGTFYFFERWGNNLTLIAAVGLNVIVAFGAFKMAARWPSLDQKKTPPRRSEEEKPVASPRLVYLAAGLAGFVFLLMEIVWYRMLAPLLGGSTFTFGLILAVALLGIGLGGVLFGVVVSGRRVTLGQFAFISALEAAFIALPYALGDRIALTTMLLQPLGSLGFYGHVIAWSAICGLVVLPAALVSGVQFPMLISLLGRGRESVGAQTGRAYAWNTGGAILGSLAGGFGLLPWLSAPGVWKLVVILLCLMAGAAAVVASQRRAAVACIAQVPTLLVMVAALQLLRAPGPTAFWRHSQIGLGRIERFTGSTIEYHDLMNSMRRDVFWETDGIESSVALSTANGLNFVVNGRCDGHTKGDSGTQLMVGLIPGALHPKPQHALVVGLGTGTTAGWLAAIPEMQQVDVVELEPAILKVAEMSRDVNRDALRNPKVNVIIGDGREVMLTTRQKYDVIASEPSNPYRAGIASLFTREYYEAVAGALNPDGIFAQWVQAYEVDANTIQTVYATMNAVFPNVETWLTQPGDLLFVGRRETRSHDASWLRSRLAQEPFQSALLHGWSVTDLEGFLAHFVADNSITLAMARAKGAALNTDDRTVLEFAFARKVSTRSDFRISQLRASSALHKADRLSLFNENVDWDRVGNLRMSLTARLGEVTRFSGKASSEQQSRVAAYNSYVKGELRNAMEHWREEEDRPLGEVLDLRLVAEGLAHEHDEAATEYIEKLRSIAPIDADAIEAHYCLQQRKFEAATALLEKVMEQLRSDPWLDGELTNRTLVVAQTVAQHCDSETLRRRLYQAMKEPFSIFNNEEKRRIILLELGRLVDGDRPGEYVLPAIEVVEPHVPWQENFLKLRTACYENTGNPRLAQAERDLAQFAAEQSPGAGDLSFLRATPPNETQTLGYATESRAGKRTK